MTMNDVLKNFGAKISSVKSARTVHVNFEMPESTDRVERLIGLGIKLGSLAATRDNPDRAIFDPEIRCVTSDAYHPMSLQLTFGFIEDADVNMVLDHEVLDRVIVLDIDKLPKRGK